MLQWGKDMALFYVGCFNSMKIVKEFRHPPPTLLPICKLKESTEKTHWLQNEFGNEVQQS